MGLYSCINILKHKNNKKDNDTWGFRLVAMTSGVVLNFIIEEYIKVNVLLMILNGI